MEKSKISFMSLTHAMSSHVHSLHHYDDNLLNIEDNPEQYYIHSHPRHCGLLYELIIDSLLFQLPQTLKDISLKSLKKEQIYLQIKNIIYEANMNVSRSIIDTSRYLWMIDVLLFMEIKTLKRFIISQVTMILLLVVQIFVNLEHISDYYIGYIVLGSICLLGFPLIYQDGIISFLSIIFYQIMMMCSISYLCLISKNFQLDIQDIIFICLYSLVFIFETYFFFYFDKKRRLLCYLLNHSQPL